MSERGDEGRQEPGSAPLWTDAWYVDFADGEGRGGFLRLGLLPNLRSAWLWAAWVEPGAIVEVRDHDVPLPRGRDLQVRSTGLWADLVCETAMMHWTLGLEAFAVALDEPGDVDAGELGTRVPLGFDLEWEAVAPPFDHPRAGGRRHARHYQHAGRVHGEVLVGEEVIEFEGWGERDRFFGVRDWWDVGWHWSAFRLGESTTLSVARPSVPGSEHATGYVAVEGQDAHPLLWADIRTEEDGEGFPRRAAYGLENGLAVDVEVLAPAPFVVPHPSGGGVSRLDRALCRFTGASGGGTGWAEWLRTPSTPRS